MIEILVKVYKEDELIKQYVYHDINQLMIDMSVGDLFVYTKSPYRIIKEYKEVR